MATEAEMKLYKDGLAELANTAIGRVSQLIRDSSRGLNIVSDVKGAPDFSVPLYSEQPLGTNLISSEIFDDLESKIKSEYLKTNDAVGVVFISMKIVTVSSQVTLNITEKCYVSSPDGQFGGLGGLLNKVKGAAAETVNSATSSEKIGGVGSGFGGAGGTSELPQKLNFLGDTSIAKTLAFPAEYIQDVPSFKKSLSSITPIFTPPSINQRYNNYLSSINNKITNTASATALGFEGAQKELKSFLVVVYSEINTNEFRMESAPFFIQPDGLDAQSKANQLRQQTQQGVTGAEAELQRRRDASRAAAEQANERARQRAATASTTATSAGTRTSQDEATQRALSEASSGTGTTGFRGGLTAATRGKTTITTQDPSTENNAEIKNQQTDDKGIGGEENSDVNTTVVNNETKAAEQERAAVQETIETSDALDKPTGKEKGTEAPSENNSADGKKEEQIQDSKEIKPLDAVKTNRGKSLSYFEWALKKENQVTKGPYVDFNPKNSGDNKTGGTTSKRVKAEFPYDGNRGSANQVKIFEGHTPETSVDIMLLSNPVNVGRFNKNIGSHFYEGCEVHLSMLNGGTNAYSAGTDSVVWAAGSDGSVAAQPPWCGISSNWPVWTNKVLRSDEKALDITATATATIAWDNAVRSKKGWTQTNEKSGFKESELDTFVAFNPPNSAAEQSAAAYSKSVNSLQDRTNNLQKSIPTKKEELKTKKEEILTLEREKADLNVKVEPFKTERATADGVKKDLEQRIQDANSKLQKYPPRASDREKQEVDAVNIPIKGEITRLKNDLSVVDKKIQGLDAEIKKVEDKIKEIDAKLDGTGTGKKAKKGLKKEVSDLESEIPTLEQELKDKTAELEELRKKGAPKLYNENGNIAKLEKDKHFTVTVDAKGNVTGGAMTDLGRNLIESIKDWPGAYLVCNGGGNGHVEVLLHVKNNKDGNAYTIGGNTSVSFNSNEREGDTYGFKSVTLPKFSRGLNLFIIKRGTKVPYTNGIGVSVKRTALLSKYIAAATATDSTNPNFDPEIDNAAFNMVFRHIVEDEK